MVITRFRREYCADYNVINSSCVSESRENDDESIDQKNPGEHQLAYERDVIY